MKKLMLVLLIVGFLLPGTALAAPQSLVLHPRPVAQPGNCTDWESAGRLHHVMSPWLKQALRSGQGGQVMKANSNTFIIGIVVTECGGRWLFAKFRNGKFVTNYFPRRGYAYIMSVAARAKYTLSTIGYAASTILSSEFFFIIMLSPDKYGIPMPGKWVVS